MCLSCAFSREQQGQVWSCFICLVTQPAKLATLVAFSNTVSCAVLTQLSVTSLQLCTQFWFSLVPLCLKVRSCHLRCRASSGSAWYLCVCRSGLVISIAEPDTLFVIKKMAKRLQVPIEKAAVSEGILALDEEAADLPAATAAHG